MAGKQGGGGGSRKYGRNSRSGGVTHSISLYRARLHKYKSIRGNLFHRPAGECANCGVTVGPFVAGPLPGSRICATQKVMVDGAEVRTALDCIKRRGALDFARYGPVAKVA
jgi:hypothetical protein